MSALVLDAGALVALDRGDRAIIARLIAARVRGDVLRTNPMVVAQVWRGTGGREAVLATALSAVEVHAIDEATGRAAGQLLARSATSDPIDASVVLLARPGDRILTSDPRDIGRLVDAAAIDVTIVPC